MSPWSWSAPIDSPAVVDLPAAVAVQPDGDPLAGVVDVQGLRVVDRQRTTSRENKPRATSRSPGPRFGRDPRSHQEARKTSPFRVAAFFGVPTSRRAIHQAAIA